jgi:hypothetical protein
VAIAFVVTGKFVVSAFAMLLLVFLTDFAKISLSTDNVRPSKNPETWNIGGFITVSVVLGIAMVAETLFLLWIGWTKFGLATNDNGLYTFSFLMLLYFAVFSVVSARERSWFWATLPSKTFMSALVADAILGTILTFVGLKDLMPLPWWQTLGVFGYAMVSCLVLNDAVKVAMIKWRVPNAVAVKVVDVSPQIAKAEPKPEAKIEPQPGAKTETKPEAKPVPPPETKGEPAPEAKAAPQPDAKVAPAAGAKAEPPPQPKAAPQPDAKAAPAAGAKAEPPPQPKAAPQPDAKAAPAAEAKAELAPEAKAAPQADAKVAPPAQVKAGPEPDDNTDVAKLMNTTLGDVLLAGVLKDPQGAGRIIAEAITHAETPIAAAKTPEGKAGPKSETAAETKDKTKAKAPANLTSKIAK